MSQSQLESVAAKHCTALAVVLLLIIGSFGRPESLVRSSAAASPEPGPAYARSVAQRDDASLHAVAFYDASHGIAAGDHGTILRTDNAGLTWQLQPSPVNCRLDDVVWVSDRRVVAVGGAYDRITNLSRGVVIVSEDGGRRWRTVGDADLPCLHQVALRDDRVLIATGDWSHAALTNQFESRDGGITWQGADPSTVRPAHSSDLSPSSQIAWAKATSQHAPVRAVCQIDQQQVWAVSDHGIILQSQDAGRSWIPSRGDQRQAAVLMIASNPDSIAWSILGKESMEMRNRVSLLLVDADDQSAGERRLAITRQVAASLGVSGVDLARVDRADVDRVAADHAGSKTADASDEQAGLPEEQTGLSEIVAWLQLHQPTVLLLDRTMSESLRAKVSDAAVAIHVDRIVEYSFARSNATRGDTMLHGAAMFAGTGILAGDLDEDARHWIAPDQLPPSATVLRRKYDRVGASRIGESVTSGISLSAGRQRTISETTASRRQLQIVQARMSESKRLTQLIETAEITDDFMPAFQRLLDQTAQEDRFRLSWIAWRHTRHRADRPARSLSLHQTILQEIASRYSETSAGKWASLRDEAMTHSLEWKRLRESLRHAAPDPAQVATVVADVAPVSPFQDHFQVAQASATIPLLVPDRTPANLRSDRDARFDESADARSSQVDLTWEFHPAVLLAREAARQRGDTDELQSAKGSANLNRLATHRSAWRHLITAQHPSVIHASRAASPPRLDGLMDDPCWTSSASEPTANLRFAYDDQYVYVALRQTGNPLHHDTGDNSNGITVRDHDLSEVDRIQLRLDIDMDLLTSMQLEFTDAGRTRDSVDGFAAWQPSWYVAAQRTERGVDFELAILRRDLTELPIHRGESWFVSNRTVRANGMTPSQPIPDPSQWLRVVFR